MPITAASDADATGVDVPESTARALLRRTWIPALLFLLAVTVRVLLIRRAGGFYADLNPDEGAYYGASLGLVHGLLPYRDLVLLHPPGIAVLLSPFAVLSYVVGDQDSMALMRIGVVLVGGLNTVLVYNVAKRIGTPAAICAGLFYAIWFPAARVERTALLEPFVITALLLALLVATGPRVTNRRLVVGGVVVGVLATVKLYTLVPLLVIIVALLIAQGWKKAGIFFLSISGGFAVVCLPFFLAAPSDMFRMIVTDQLGRSGETDFWLRMRDILALTKLDPGVGAMTIVVVTVLLAITVITCVKIAPARLWTALLVVQIAILMSTPNLFFNYTAFASASLALIIGGFAQVVCGGIAAPIKPARFILVMALVCAAGITTQVSRDPQGQGFPVAAATNAVKGATCVTSDSATALILTNTFSSNVANGCPIEVDFTGLVYETRGLPLSRVANPEFQRIALEYLNKGDRVIIMREEQDGLTPQTLADLQRRPVLYQSGRVTVYGQLPAAAQ